MQLFSLNGTINRHTLQEYFNFYVSYIQKQFQFRLGRWGENFYHQWMIPREEPKTKRTNNKDTHRWVSVQPQNLKSSTRQAFFCNIYAKTNVTLIDLSNKNSWNQETKIDQMYKGKHIMKLIDSKSITAWEKEKQKTLLLRLINVFLVLPPKKMCSHKGCDHSLMCIS